LSGKAGPSPKGGLSPKKVARNSFRGLSRKVGAGLPGKARAKLEAAPTYGAGQLSEKLGAGQNWGLSPGQIGSCANIKSFSGETSGPVEGDLDEDAEAAFGETCYSPGPGNLENGREFSKTLFRD